MARERKITDWVDPKDKTGQFIRGGSKFRNSVSKVEGAEFPAEKNRYHLYVSYACPWAHRTLIVRKLKGLEEIIPYTSVHWEMLERVGWRFARSDDKDAPGQDVTADPLHKNFTHLQDLYYESQSDYEGRYTVPVLWDKKQGKIVNNESSEIIRMFYSEFDHLLPEKYQKVVLYPENLRKEIDEANEWHYNLINNGVYKTGFATTQQAYESNLYPLFEALKQAEKHLATSGPYYFGKDITETDVRLFTTLVRFDPVYVQHFKCNIGMIRDSFPNLHTWLRKLYWNNAAFGPETTNFVHIRNHYTKSHKQINPLSITPVGPLPNIMKEDEEVPAVEALLLKQKQK